MAVLSMVAYVGCAKTSEYKFVVPAGATFMAVADMWGESVDNNSISYEITAETNILSTMSSGNADFIIAPINIGANIHASYKAGNAQHDYKLMSVATWSVIYFVTNDESLKSMTEGNNVQEFMTQFSGEIRRSEERRVGKECRCWGRTRRRPDHELKTNCR